MRNIHRQDDTFVIEKNGYPYHVTPEMPEFSELSTAYQANPSAFSEEAEPVVPEPTYQELRAAEYPDYREFLDAQVKINSGDEALITAGQAQLEAYYAACLAIKDKYPKL